MLDWLVSNWEMVFGVLGAILAIAMLLVKLTTNVIDDMVVSFLNKLVEYFKGHKPATKSPSEPMGTEDIPDKLPPDPSTPAGAMKRTMDRKMGNTGDKL